VAKTISIRVALIVSPNRWEAIGSSLLPDHETARMAQHFLGTEPGKLYYLTATLEQPDPVDLPAEIEPAQ
jgi:hypothetical protein